MSMLTEFQSLVISSNWHCDALNCSMATFAVAGLFHYLWKNKQQNWLINSVTKCHLSPTQKHGGRGMFPYCLPKHGPWLASSSLSVGQADKLSVGKIWKVNSSETTSWILFKLGTDVQLDWKLCILSGSFGDHRLTWYGKVSKILFIIGIKVK